MKDFGAAWKFEIQIIEGTKHRILKQAIPIETRNNPWPHARGGCSSATTALPIGIGLRILKGDDRFEPSVSFGKAHGVTPSYI
jgi:hypothetical protein